MFFANHQKLGSLGSEFVLGFEPGFSLAWKLVLTEYGISSRSACVFPWSLLASCLGLFFPFAFSLSLWEMRCVDLSA